MQKIIRRTALAEKQVARRYQRVKDKNIRSTQRTERENFTNTRKDEVKTIRLARKAHKEDYELGSLAPRRDVGEYKDTYGTISPMHIQGRKMTLAERIKLDPVSGRRSSLAVGDRVVLLEGRDKGKISKIVSLDIERHECKVEGLNMVDVPVPEYMRKADGDHRPTRSVERPVYLHKVRLVIPLPDAETGAMRDVIVKKLVSGPVWHDHVTDSRKWDRYVADTDIKVPWPKVDEPVYEAYDCDTLRQEVEEITYTPQLRVAPFPSSVLDELRNKYSVFRKRHDPEFVERMIQIDKDAEKKKRLDKSMRSPLKIIARLKRKLRKAKGKPRLSPEMKQRISEAIANKQAAAAVLLEQRKQLLETTGRLRPIVPMSERSRKRPSLHSLAQEKVKISTAVEENGQRPDQISLNNEN